MPPYGPRGNPFAAPAGHASAARRARRVAALVVPAVVGAAAALATVAATGNLGGGDREAKILREPVYLPAAAPAAPLPEGTEADGGRLAGAKSVQRIVREATPAVVTVSAGAPGGQVGSGFLVDARGRVLTNDHVLAGDGPVRVTFEDGTESEARVLGRDASSDLAVLRVDPPPGARPLALGASAGLSVGDPVVAIGNPFRLERTATTGIVSAVKRVIDAPNGFTIQNVIQTDAAINQGNSGGPLLDRRGAVVGINAQIATGSGGNDGVGFAVPIDTVRPVIESIVATGTARHAWVGVEGTTLTPAIAAALRIPGRRGVVVVAVDDRGPARAAGLRPAAEGRDAEVPRGADLIVAVAGRPVEDMADVSQAVASRRVGQRLAVTVLREGRRTPLVMTLADRPGDVGLQEP